MDIKKLSTYKHTLSSNMNDKQYSNLASFLIKHDFKNVRIMPCKVNKASAPTESKLNGKDSPFNKCVYGWQEMSEYHKLTILKHRFSMGEICKDWLSELPQMSEQLQKLKGMQKEECKQFLKLLKECED